MYHVQLGGIKMITLGGFANFRKSRIREPITLDAYGRLGQHITVSQDPVTLIAS